MSKYCKLFIILTLGVIKSAFDSIFVSCENKHSNINSNQELEYNKEYLNLRNSYSPEFKKIFYDGESVEVISGNITRRNLQKLVDLNTNSILSEELNNAYQDGRGQLVFEKGQGVYVPNVFMKYNINNNETVKVNLKNLNSQYGTDVYELKGMFKNDKILVDGQDYYMNYTLSDNIVYSKNYENKFDPKYMDSYMIHCNYSSNPLDFKYKKLGGFNFNKTEKFRLGTFALKPDRLGVYFLLYNNNTINIDNVQKFIIENKSGLDISTIEFRNLFVIDQPYEEKTFLVCETIDQMLIFYELIINKYGQLYYMYYHTSLRPTLDNNATVITDVDYVRESILVSSDKGLLVYEKDKKNKTNEIVEEETSENEPEPNNNGVLISREATYTLIRNMPLFITNDGFKRAFEINNIIVLEKMIYVLVQGYGIKIIEINAFGFVNYDFRHKNLKHIDLVVNPLLNTKYLGITFVDSFDQQEFFMELNVDDEIYPEINKIFLSSKSNTRSHYITLDLFLGMFYDPNDNTLLVIRRGMLNNIPFQTYKYNLNSLFRVSEDAQIVVTSLYNPETELNELFIVDNNSFNAYILSDFSHTTDEMYCKFLDIGNYNVTLEKYSEICESSLEYKYAYSYCDFMIYLNFRAIGEDMRDFTLMGIILGTLLGFIFLLFTFFIIVKTQCCKDFSMFTGKKHKSRPTREELYIDSYLNKKRSLKQRINDTDENINSRKPSERNESKFSSGFIAKGQE